MSRSLYKGPFISFCVLQKIDQLNSNRKKNTVKTWSRSTTILPSMIGHTFFVYTGLQHLPVFISDQMIGHKLGAFSPTKTFRSHIKKDKKGKRY